MTVAGRPVFVSARSAFEKNVTPSLAQLLSRSRSGVVLSTHAVSFTSTAVRLESVTVMVVRPSNGSMPRLHVTTPPAMPQAPPGAAHADEMVKLPSETCESVITTFAASDGPGLSTVMVQMALVPVGAGASGLHSLWTHKSERLMTSVVRLKVLFVAVGSSSWAATTVTTLVMV